MTGNASERAPKSLLIPSDIPGHHAHNTTTVHQLAGLEELNITLVASQRLRTIHPRAFAPQLRLRLVLLASGRMVLRTRIQMHTQCNLGIRADTIRL